MVPFAIIRHPNDPSRLVRLEEPLRSATFDLGQRLAAAVTPIAVQKADGTILYAKKPDGTDSTTPEIFISPAPESIASKCARLALYVKEWSGIKDREGNAVPLAPANLFWLYETANEAKLKSCFWCKTEKDAHDPKADHPYMDEPTFGMIIFHEIYTNEHLFDMDPTPIVSASPLT